MKTTLVIVPLLAGWLVAGFGTWMSLVTGMAPVLALGGLLLWTVLTALVGRTAVAGGVRWRKLLPYVLLAVGLYVYQSACRLYFNRPSPGFPRVYYYPEPKEK